jgi:hypothetical protein
MRRFFGLALAAGVCAFAVGGLAAASAKAADMQVPEGPPPQGYGPPPPQQGYYPAPPPPYVLGPVYGGYYRPYGPWGYRGWAWRGYGPHYAWGYGRWGHRHW